MYKTTSNNSSYSSSNIITRSFPCAVHTLCKIISYKKLVSTTVTLYMHQIIILIILKKATIIVVVVRIIIYILSLTLHRSRSREHHWATSPRKRHCTIHLLFPQHDSDNDKNINSNSNNTNYKIKTM